MQKIESAKDGETIPNGEVSGLCKYCKYQTKCFDDGNGLTDKPLSFLFNFILGIFNSKFLQRIYEPIIPTIFGNSRYALLTKTSLSALTITNSMGLSGGGETRIFCPVLSVPRLSMSPPPKFT